jgi:hypothetical protein
VTGQFVLRAWIAKTDKQFDHVELASDFDFSVKPGVAV